MSIYSNVLKYKCLKIKIHVSQEMKWQQFTPKKKKKFRGLHPHGETHFKNALVDK